MDHEGGPISDRDDFPRDDRATHANLPDRRSLSVEPLPRGVAVYAPDFYVWDRDGAAAFRWASELLEAPRDATSPDRERRRR